MTRRIARELVVHLLFAGEYGEDKDALIGKYLTQERFDSLVSESEVYSSLPDRSQKDYVYSAVIGVSEHIKELNGYISKYSVGWELDRISRIAKCIMRLSMFEMLYMDIPVAASVNEAIELCKKYDGKDSASFINGILASFEKAELSK